ncbi:hypothetical protein [Aeromicrobium sp. Leaf245]|uniref:hypothetical protein n=1 Tax=Aeromicrobium sp. Leaf245 TaxID=1736306 RepID=UPI000A8B6E0A|nr:hypothetical protein [Aeromicrobium sp. Leaf245]
MTSTMKSPDDWVPVERRWLGMDRATLVPAAVVTALVVLAFWVLPAIDDHLQVDDPIRPGDVVQVGSAELVPATGWNLVAGVRQGEAKTTGMYPQQAVLTSGGLTFQVLVDDYDGTAAELLEQVEQNNEQVKDTAFAVSGDPTTIQSTGGDRGALATFTSADSDGFLAAYVFDGVGVEVVAVGPSSLSGDSLGDEVARMLLSIRPAEGSAS